MHFAGRAATVGTIWVGGALPPPRRLGSGHAPFPGCGFGTGGKGTTWRIYVACLRDPAEKQDRTAAHGLWLSLQRGALVRHGNECEATRMV